MSLITILLSHKTLFPPSPNFNWTFLHGFWTLVPKEFTKDITLHALLEEELNEAANREIWSEKNQIDEFIPETGTLMSDA